MMGIEPSHGKNAKIWIGGKWIPCDEWKVIDSPIPLWTTPATRGTPAPTRYVEYTALDQGALVTECLPWAPGSRDKNKMLCPAFECWFIGGPLNNVVRGIPVHHCDGKHFAIVRADRPDLLLIRPRAMDLLRGLTSGEALRRYYRQIPLESGVEVFSCLHGPDEHWGHVFWQTSIPGDRERPD